MFIYTINKVNRKERNIIMCVDGKAKRDLITPRMKLIIEQDLSEVREKV